MSAVKQIKVGIIGCGVIAPCHIGSYLKLPEVRVVHLCDKVPAKAEKLAKEYGKSFAGLQRAAGGPGG